MSFHAIPLPAALLETNRLRPERDIAFNHKDWCFSPDGHLYIYSEVFYNAFRYRKDDGLNDTEADERGYYSFLVSVYDRDGRLLRQVPLDEVGAEVRVRVSLDWGSNFTILPGGLFLVSMSGNRCRVYDASLSRCLNAYTVGTEDVDDTAALYRRGFARLVSPVPDGRLLCVLSELGDGVRPNLLAVSREPFPDLTGKPQPVLRYLASLEAFSWTRPPHPIPYLRLDGGDAFERTKRPVPSLEAACRERFGRFVHGPSIRQFLALSPEHFLLSVFGRRESRSSQDYYFLLLSGEGKVYGRLLLTGDDSPYLEDHFAACWDACRGRVVYKSKANLYFFGPHGELLRQFPLGSERLKGLQKFHLAGAVSPSGRILFQRADDHAFLAFDPPGDDSRIEHALADALGQYAGWKRVQSKAMRRVSKKWLAPAAGGSRSDGDLQ